MTRARSKTSLPVVGLVLGMIACNAEDGRSGIEEPLSVQGAQFVDGDLPGVPADSDADPGEDAPTVTAATPSVAALYERMAGIQFYGLASRNADTVGVQVRGLGSGYYLFPTGAVDAQDDNALTWSIIADFNESLPPGRHQLLTVSFDEEGNPGKQATTSVCVRSIRPDNGNSCFPNIEPPAFVLSVEWDTAVDLDLVLVTPSGQIIEPKNPGLVDPEVPGPVGYLTHDGNGGCQFDGRQREDIVFDETPPRGKYQVYVNLARACGEHTVNYVVSRHLRDRLEDDEFGVSSRDVGAGTLIAEQANGGAKLGTYVTTLTSQ